SDSRRREGAMASEPPARSGGPGLDVPRLSSEGVLVVDKPAGPTSHDVVAVARRALHVDRIGHTGTLDPLATGVLPLVMGRATRLAALLSGSFKEYTAQIRFGASTPAFDATGRIAVDPATGQARVLVPPPPAPAGLSRESVERALDDFRGTFSQVPPPFSAKKKDGVHAYTRARRNERVDMRPVEVNVPALALLCYSPGLATVHVTCSPGFYVRSLAHDLGERLGCGAYLEALRRTRAGEFDLTQAAPLDEIEREGVAAADRIIPLERLLQAIPAAILTGPGARRASHGCPIRREDVAADTHPREAGTPGVPRSVERWRLVDGSGMLLGIAERGDGGLLHPVVVLV
ncbi:MAG TPA: tRNA pseudouridine(55) synthase TruB, partial [Vicinamibacterales bacterium]|nr:tRNA pseudouridine(55) synthase TruB [Vicinamibacterales bacterium]